MRRRDLPPMDARLQIHDTYSRWDSKSSKQRWTPASTHSSDSSSPLEDPFEEGVSSCRSNSMSCASSMSSSSLAKLSRPQTACFQCLDYFVPGRVVSLAWIVIAPSPLGDAFLGVILQPFLCTHFQNPPIHWAYFQLPPNYCSKWSWQVGPRPTKLKYFYCN